MAYEKLNLKNDDTLDETHIAHMEEGIASASGVTRIENTDSENKIPLRSLESGMYILYGYFTAFEGSTAAFTFSADMIAAVLKQSSISYVQVFYPKGNAIQYLEISDEDYSRQDFKGVNAESIANKVTEISEDSDDDHYPSAKAVYDALAALEKRLADLEA